jgi:hypothetical protein
MYIPLEDTKVIKLKNFFQKASEYFFAFLFFLFLLTMIFVGVYNTFFPSTSSRVECCLEPIITKFHPQSQDYIQKLSLDYPQIVNDFDSQFLFDMASESCSKIHYLLDQNKFNSSLNEDYSIFTQYHYSEIQKYYGYKNFTLQDFYNITKISTQYFCNQSYIWYFSN